ncbi:MAG TPA: hypothetical protein VIO15_00455, partial [Bacteroidales bacterium]
MITLIILAVLLGNIGSVLMASLMLKFKNEYLQKLTKHINAFAGGTLLGAAFLGMLPNAIKI